MAGLDSLNKTFCDGSNSGSNTTIELGELEAYRRKTALFIVTTLKNFL